MSRLAAKFPEYHLALALLRRGAGTWCLVRIAVGITPSLMGPANIHLDPAAAIGVIGLTWLVGLVRANLRNEPRFLPNLGVSPLVTAGLSVAPAMLAEIVVGTLVPA